MQPAHPTIPCTGRPRTRRRRAVAAVVLGTLVAAATLGASTGAGADPSPAPAAVAATAATTSTTGPTASPRTVPPAATSVSAYWVVADDGGIFALGGTPFYGSTGGIRLNKPVVAMAPTSPSDSHGYREVASDGGIFDFGDARFYGSTGDLHLNRPVVGMAATADGGGYWLVASDGGVFSFGDAGFYGSTGDLHLNRPIVGMAATGDGGGYWLVASDGGVFAFGDAGFYGSTGNLTLQQPVVGMAATQDHRGYWMVASDGGVFAFGDARYYGSLGGVPQSRPIVSMTATADGKGYWFTNDNGAVTAFGDATYWGSTPQVLSAPVVGMAQGSGNGTFTGSSYPSGSYGYDVWLGTCAALPPAPHTIGIVQVEEPGFPNTCLAQEAAWAGAGLNLYIYMNYGTSPSSADARCLTSVSPLSCNYGFDAAVHAFDDARAAGVTTSVAWWLDIEDASFDGNQPGTAALVQGAIDGLHYEGLNSVGIYASPGNWGNLVGDYQPAVPYWAADWGILPTTTCADVKSLYPGLPTGPVQIVQYSSPSAPLRLGGLDASSYDNDYAC